MEALKKKSRSQFFMSMQTISDPCVYFGLFQTRHAPWTSPPKNINIYFMTYIILVVYVPLSFDIYFPSSGNILVIQYTKRMIDDSYKQGKWKHIKLYPGSKGKFV